MDLLMTKTKNIIPKKTVNARVWAILPRGISAQQMLVVKRNNTRLGDVTCLPAGEQPILSQSGAASPWESCLCVNHNKALKEQTSRA